VEFKVNDVKQDYAMKLGEGGEAFFVFETSDEIPASLQTSPLISPTTSPKIQSEENLSASLQEPDYLDLDQSKAAVHPPLVSRGGRAASDLGIVDLHLVTLVGLLISV
jgi:phosphatidate phosphatase LPIN